MSNLSNVLRAFGAGAIGGVANVVALVILWQFVPGPGYAREFLYTQMTWGGIWGLAFVFPILPNNWIASGVCGLGPGCYVGGAVHLRCGTCLGYECRHRDRGQFGCVGSDRVVAVCDDWHLQGGGTGHPLVVDGMDRDLAGAPCKGRVLDARLV